MKREASGSANSSHPVGRVGLAAGPLLMAATLILPAPAGLSVDGWRAAGVGTLMAVWWMTEAIPIPATALLPLVLFPLLGIAEVEAAASPYANPLIFLFLGGFLLALGLERWGLPRRIALAVISAVGTGPEAVIAGFMASAAFLSMWVSNTATAMMMLPIGMSVLDLAGRSEVGGGRTGREGEDAPSGPEALDGNFGSALMLGIAYACSIGGVATLIGTPPNAFLAGFFAETYGVEITFSRWMTFGLPLAVVGLPIAWWVLVRWAFPIELEELPGGSEFLRERRRQLGPISTAERRVGAVFTLVALAWMGRPLLEGVLPGVTDAGIAVAGGVALFVLPAGEGNGESLLAWSDTARLPWGVLVLFGGGLSLASALQSTGVAGWLGQATSGLAGTSLVIMVGVPATLVVLLTELTSNTATAAAFLPVLASVAVGAGQDPRLLAVPAAVAASCAFMLPVATPPNAIVYGSGEITVPEMARAGIVLNVLFVVLLTATALLLLPPVFGVEVGVVPAWAGGG